uniref:BHLH domain-containing protein n=1 Tax=Branchiostoma floridae TaxID=7739 RepID=C3XRR1_BRAFL|eukprot:XP_002613370.1 hypothetical protein BRAFLDRAFT_118748 [Branchiostoma floridae]
MIKNRLALPLSNHSKREKNSLTGQNCNASSATGNWLPRHLAGPLQTHLSLLCPDGQIARVNQVHGTLGELYVPTVPMLDTLQRTSTQPQPPGMVVTGETTIAQGSPRSCGSTSPTSSCSSVDAVHKSFDVTDLNGSSFPVRPREESAREAEDTAARRNKDPSLQGLSREERRRRRRATAKYRTAHATRERIRVEAFNVAFAELRKLLPTLPPTRNSPRSKSSG